MVEWSDIASLSKYFWKEEKRSIDERGEEQNTKEWGQSEEQYRPTTIREEWMRKERSIKGFNCVNG